MRGPCKCCFKQKVDWVECTKGGGGSEDSLLQSAPSDLSDPGHHIPTSSGPAAPRIPPSSPWTLQGLCRVDWGVSSPRPSSLHEALTPTQALQKTRLQRRSADTVSTRLVSITMTSLLDDCTARDLCPMSVFSASAGRPLCCVFIKSLSVAKTLRRPVQLALKTLFTGSSWKQNHYYQRCAGYRWEGAPVPCKGLKGIHMCALNGFGVTEH